MTRKSKSHLRSFTLIELMVVISIISFLSSIVLAGLNSARAKALEAKRLAEAQSVKTALALYYEKTGSEPYNNYDGYSQEYAYNAGNAYAYEDFNHPNAPQHDSGVAYKASMQQLVDAGVLSSIPHSSDPQNPYAYYDYGQGSASGAVFLTRIPPVQQAPPSSGGSCSISNNTPPCPYGINSLQCQVWLTSYPCNSTSGTAICVCNSY